MFFPDDLRWRPKWTRPRHLSDGQIPLFYIFFMGILWIFTFMIFTFQKSRVNVGFLRKFKPNLWVLREFTVRAFTSQNCLKSALEGLSRTCALSWTVLQIH